jgi:deoxycytidylate deaminase
VDLVLLVNNMLYVRPTMEYIWMQTAILLAQRSKCSRAKVGCIITTKDLRHVLGNGYNGYAAGIDYICTPERCDCLHAENNAVIDAGSEHKDKVFFVTMFPCLPCTIQIINSGCSKLYYYDTYKNDSKHWSKYPEVLKLLDSSNIEIIKI